MKKMTLFLIFFLFNLVAKAQYNFKDNFTMPRDYVLPTNPVLVGKERFFNNDSLFREGELVTKKRHFKTELGYRFDQIERALEVQFESGKKMYIDIEKIVLFKLFFEDNTVVFIPLTLPKEHKKTLVQVIYKTPTLQLYRDVHKETDRTYKRSYDLESDYYDEVRNDYHYYFRKSDKDALVEIKIKAKSFAKVLPKMQNKIMKLFEKEQEKGNLTVSKICKIMAALDNKDE
jgi:hypothetical protein